MSIDQYKAKIAERVGSNGMRGITGEELKEVFMAGADVMQEVQEQTKVGLNLGFLTPASAAAPATGVHRGQATEAGTYTNFKDAALASIVVTAGDLDIVNGAANYRVIIEVRDGVARTYRERVKGDAGTFNNLTRTESLISLTLTNAYLKPDGTISTLSTWRTSNFKSVSEGEIFNIIADTSPAAQGVEAPRVVGYNNADVATVLLGKGASLGGTDFTIPAGIVKIKTCSYQSPTMVLKKVSLLIDESVLPFKKSDTFDPDNDLNLITAKQTSDYLLDRVFSKKNTTFVNAYITSAGVVTPSSNWRTDANFISVVEGERWRYNGKTDQTNIPMSVVGYDNSGVFHSVLVPNGDYSVTPIDIIIPAGVFKVKSSGFNTTPPNLFKEKAEIKNKFLPTSLIKSVINKTWASVGTSITYQDGVNYLGTPTGVTGAAKGYQTRVREVFEFLGFSNYGYSGNSLGGLTTEDTSSILTKTGWVSHDIFTMESITNDFKRNIPIGTRADYDNATGITTYYGALRAFKDKVLSLNANAIVIVANALKRNNAGYTSTSANTAGHTLLDYEKALMVIARLNDWRFIDQNRESGVNDENLTYTTLDGLHPNDFGYRLISKVWIREFWLLSKAA